MGSRANEIAALTVLAALAGLLFLSRESFGLDEAFSIALAGSDWGTILGELRNREINGSPYYVLLWAWLGFGEGEFAVRSLSVLVAAAAIPPFYALATRLFDARTARIGSLLLVANSFFVYYQQDARSYVLALLLVVLATYAWTRWVERPTPAWAAAYAVAAAGAIYAHLFSLFVIGAHAAALAARGRPLPSFSALARVYALLGVLLIPLMLYFATGYTGQLWWVKEPTFGDLAENFATMAGVADPPAFPLSGWILGTGYLAMCCLALVAARRSRRDDRERDERWRYVLALAWLLFPLLGSFLVSFWKPIFVERYLLVALPALVLLAGAGLASISSRRIRFAAVATLVGLSIAQLAAQYHDETKEDWRAATAHVEANARAGDAVVIYRPYVRVPFEHYFEPSPALADGLTPLYPEFPWGGVDLGTDQSQPPDFAELARAEDRYDRIWLVLAHHGFNEEGARATERLTSVLGGGRGSRTETFPGLSVTLYASKAGARPAG